MNSDRLKFAVQMIMSRLGRNDEFARQVITRVISDVVNEEHFADTNTANDLDRDFPPPSRSYVKLPFSSKDKDADPLGRCIARAAQCSGVSHFEAARGMTVFSKNWRSRQNQVASCEFPDSQRWVLIYMSIVRQATRSSLPDLSLHGGFVSKCANGVRPRPRAITS